MDTAQLSGRELDKAVGKAFGFQPRLSWEILNADETATTIGFESEGEAKKWFDDHPYAVKDRHVGTWEMWPSFSESITDAMRVVEKLYAADWAVEIHRSVVIDDDWMVKFSSVTEGGKDVAVAAKTLPEAITRAALAAIEGENGEAR